MSVVLVHIFVENIKKFHHKMALNNTSQVPRVTEILYNISRIVYKTIKNFEPGELSLTAR